MSVRELLLPPPSTPIERIGRPVHFRWLAGIAWAVFVLSLLDGVLTLHWLDTARAFEGNPIMDALIGFDAVAFLLGKQLLVGFGLHSLWRMRRRRLAVVAIMGAFLVYYVLLLYHLQALDLGLFGGFHLLDPGPLFAEITP